MTETTFTFRVEDELKEAFAIAAKAQDRTAAQLIRDYMRDYIRQQAEKADYDAWFRAQVQAALDDPRPGIPAEEVEAEFAARRAETLARMGRSGA